MLIIKYSKFTKGIIVCTENLIPKEILHMDINNCYSTFWFVKYYHQFAPVCILGPHNSLASSHFAHKIRQVDATPSSHLNLLLCTS